VKPILFAFSVVACFTIVFLVSTQPTLTSVEPELATPSAQHEASSRASSAAAKEIALNPLDETRVSNSSRASAGTKSDTENDTNKPTVAQKKIVRVKINDVAPEGFDSITVGRPFPISESVRPVCKGEGSMACELEGDMRRFSQEPRDGNWAPGVEERVRSIVETRNKGFVVRNLECRVTLCAMEVASTQGQLGPRRNLNWDEGIALRILPLLTTTGEETPKSGQNYITVTLVLYERIQ
jgi:hypothetical protein